MYLLLLKYEVTTGIDRIIFVNDWEKFSSYEEAKKGLDYIQSTNRPIIYLHDASIVNKVVDSIIFPIAAYKE